MPYISLYRKWRPQSFADVVGQDNIVRTLENSLNSGRISHAYLFCGPRGTGKTTVARLLAKGLNCQNGPTATPCGECGECRALAAGASLNVSEIDGASNRGIDDIRELRVQVLYTPINAKYKIYIVDEVHMLTIDAFNALLKTLEEPPAHVVFIFATTDPQKLPATILSRVQRYDFKRFSDSAVAARLETVAAGEGIKVEKEALQLIAEHAEGGMRDALGILEKCAAFSDAVTVQAAAEVLGVAPQEQVKDFVQFVLAGSKAEALQIVADLYSSGKDLVRFAHSVLGELRKSLLAEQGNEEKGLRAIELLSDAVREMRFAPDPRIPLEVAALKIATDYNPAIQSGAIEELEEKIRSLQQEIAVLKSRKIPERTSREANEEGVSQGIKITGRTDQERTAQILEIWPDYLGNLRRERLMQCEAFLKEGTPVEVVDNAVIVAFPRDRGFHKASIEQDNHKQSAERVLAKTAGASLQLKCVFQDEVPGLGETSAAKTIPPQTGNVQQPEKEGAEGDEQPDAQKFIDVSLETFGGRVFTKPQGE